MHEQDQHGVPEDEATRAAVDRTETPAPEAADAEATGEEAAGAGAAGEGAATDGAPDVAAGVGDAEAAGAEAPDGEAANGVEAEAQAGVGADGTTSPEGKDGQDASAEPPRALFCRKCGVAIPEGQPFCGQCGTPANGPVAGAHATATHAAKLPGGLPKQALVGIAVAVVAVVAIVVLATGALSPKPDPEPEPFDFTEEFSDYEGESWCTFGDDGSYMTIDTNPYDISDYIDFDAMQAIEDVNDKLGFPDSTLENMNHTRALDGTQTDEVDGFEVSWRYHPDSGMEVTYERTDSAGAEEE